MSVGQSNNYAYIVSDDSKTESVIFDPSFPDDVAPILKPQIESLNFTKIINTHHHWDHSHGNDKVRSWFSTKPKVFGGKDCQSVDYTPSHQETFRIGKGIKVTALHTPCHTQDSICWYLEDGSDRVVFTGDTLFIGGCGRMFEGTAPEMHKALNEVLSALPDDTKVYPGHEYTKANVKFPKKILGDSSGQVADKETNRLDQLASNNEQTQGKSTIGDEKKYNIFMRVTDPEIQKLTGQSAPADVLGALRLAKDKDGGNVSKDDLIGIMKNYKGAGAQKDEL